MNYEQFVADVDTMVANIRAIATMPAKAWSWNSDYSLEVCECAAHITGYNVTLVKMFNKEFRDGACEMMFERALGQYR